MKRIDTYIVEKFKISKKTNITPSDIELLSYSEFINKLNKDIKGLPSAIADEMISKRCFPNLNVHKYKYKYIDPDKYNGKFGYRYLIQLGEKLVQNLKHEEYTLKRIYVDHIIDLYVFHYINVNLSDDDGDEHYIYFIDDVMHKYYLYQFVKNKQTYIKDFK